MTHIWCDFEKYTLDQEFDVLKNYNMQQDHGKISKAGVCEGGFEVQKTEEECKKTGIYGWPAGLDPNQKVRQLRWSRGHLLPGYHEGLLPDEVKLLFESLKAVFGEDKVKMV